MTDAERALWQRLRSKQVHGFRFRRQVPLGSFIADFCCHEAGLVIEVDGAQHQFSENYDDARTNFLKGAGYRVLRFWNNEVLANIDGVMTAIAEALPHPHPNPSPFEGEGLRLTE